MCHPSRGTCDGCCTYLGATQPKLQDSELACLSNSHERAICCHSNAISIPATKSDTGPWGQCRKGHWCIASSCCLACTSNHRSPALLVAADLLGCASVVGALPKVLCKDVRGFIVRVVGKESPGPRSRVEPKHEACEGVKPRAGS